MFKLHSQIALTAILLGSCFAFSQTPAAPDNTSQSSSTMTSQSGPQPCAQPAKTFDMHDYTGPFSKRLATSQEKVGATSLRLPDGSNLRPCPLNVGEKFRLFVQKSVKPTAFLHAGWEGGLSQWNNDDPSFGQGAEGYGKRYGASLADSTSHKFFGTFLYPSIFQQDPHYYRLGSGTGGERLRHALTGVFVAHSDSGGTMPNYSEWLGTASYKVLGNLYHPGNSRGFIPTARRTGLSIGGDIGWDVAREFWPEIAHKFHLPFKNREYAENHPNSGNSSRSSSSVSDTKKPAPPPPTGSVPQ
jgi:hypothetical protein